MNDLTVPSEGGGEAEVGYNVRMFFTRIKSNIYKSFSLGKSALRPGKTYAFDRELVTLCQVQ